MRNEDLYIIKTWTFEDTQKDEVESETCHWVAVPVSFHFNGRDSVAGEIAVWESKEDFLSGKRPRKLADEISKTLRFDFELDRKQQADLHAATLPMLNQTQATSKLNSFAVNILNGFARAEAVDRSDSQIKSEFNLDVADDRIKKSESFLRNNPFIKRIFLTVWENGEKHQPKLAKFK